MEKSDITVLDCILWLVVVVVQAFFFFLFSFFFSVISLRGCDEKRQDTPRHAKIGQDEREAKL